MRIRLLEPTVQPFLSSCFIRHRHCVGMSSFFTTPRLQKRKRSEAQSKGINKKIRSSGGGGVLKSSSRSQAPRDDESVSGSESSFSGDEGYESARSGLSEEKETAAEKRLRLAEEYLASLRQETEQEVGFDAEEIDRDLIAERLKEDVAETKGKLYRFVASSYHWSEPTGCFFSAKDGAVTTAVAVHGNYIYTATKDIRITKWRSPKLTRAHQRAAATQVSVGANTQSELSKAKRRKMREKRRKEREAESDSIGTTWEDGPVRLMSTKGSQRQARDKAHRGHVAPILCLACSPDGRFLVSGGADRRIVVWDAEKLTPKRVFTQHRAAVTSLAFRRNSNQLFSASADRTVKVWSLDELAYVETLFGHQDEVYDVGALGMERCVSVGGRDRTARVWKVVEETQLVFRGGGSAAEKDGKRDRAAASSLAELKHSKARSALGEGSIDRVALIDDEMFVTGSDNGSLCLWSVQKKKPVHVVPLAHGLDPPLQKEMAFADLDLDGDLEVPGPPLPRWITALAALPYSDLVVSGSWDGSVRLWRVSEDKRRLEPLSTIGDSGQADGPQAANGDLPAGIDHGNADFPDGETTTEKAGSGRAQSQPYGTVKGIINDLKLLEEGERGKEKLYILVGTGKEHRLGRWLTRPGRNGAHLLAVSRGALKAR